MVHPPPDKCLTGLLGEILPVNNAIMSAWHGQKLHFPFRLVLYQKPVIVTEGVVVRYPDLQEELDLVAQ